jgi:hypothetical protein
MQGERSSTGVFHISCLAIPANCLISANRNNPLLHSQLPGHHDGGVSACKGSSSQA